jgi:glycosyltransferase involved in cell wall biosynthesis
MVLVGEGPHEKHLKDLASHILPGDRIIFAPFCRRPWEVLSGIDVFVMPSRNEGFGLALAEAMACECCVVATAVGAVPKIVSRPDIGWLIPEGKVDAFSAAMIEAASLTPERRAIMGKRAREHIVANFNGEVQFNALAELIESVALTTAAAQASRCRDQIKVNQ